MKPKRDYRLIAYRLARMLDQSITIPHLVHESKHWGYRADELIKSFHIEPGSSKYCPRYIKR